MRPTKITYEQRYSDDSGVELGVSLNRDSIEIEAVNTIDFPVDKLQWVISCLICIQDMLEESE